MTTRQIPMRLPLDDDGFLRRECPNCEREFKVIPEQRQGAPAPASSEGTYYCPYCHVHADADQYWTKAQLEHMQGVAVADVLGPVLRDFGRQLERLDRSGGGLIKVKAEMKGKPPRRPPNLAEANDMVRVDFVCHQEPVKVLADWTAEVACPVCGVKRPAPQE